MSLYFVPNVNWNGTTTLQYAAKDDQGLADATAATATITVSAVNDAPVITSNGGGASANITAAENQTAVTTVTSSDIDGGTAVYSIVGGADAALFTIDAATGVLRFVGAPDFESPTDAGANGVYNLTVQVADGNGGFETQALAVRVVNVNEAPLITSGGGAASIALGIAENQSAVTAVSASDADGDTLLYRIAGGTDAARFAIDASSGALRFIAAPDFEAPRDANANNVYELTVGVSDGNGGTATQAIAVAVSNLNEAPGNIAPAAATVNERAAAGTLVATVTASDPDAGDVLSFSLVADGNGRFVVDPASGRLLVAPGAILDYGTSPTQTLLLRVTDAQGLSTEQTLVITLNDVPEATGPATAPEAPAPAPAPAPEPAPAPAPAPAPSARTEVGLLDRRQTAGRDPNAPAQDNEGNLVAGALGDELQTRDDRAVLQRIRQVREGDAMLVASVSLEGWPVASFSDASLDALLIPHTSEGLRFNLFNLRGSSLEADDELGKAAQAATRGMSEAFQAALSDPVRVASVTLTAGFVWWLTRSGGLLTSILMGIPAWRHVDLLPVLAPRRDDDDDDDGLGPDSQDDHDRDRDDHDSLTDKIFSNTSRQFGESSLMP